MKIIEYKWSREVKQGAFWITEEDYKGNEEKLKPYHWQKDVHNEFSDEKGYFLIRSSGEETSFAKVVIEELAILIQQGFTLSDKAQKQYEYWGKRDAETLEKEKNERDKIKEKKRQEELAKEQERQERIKYDYVLWCEKYGCPAPNGCGKCERQFIAHCRPALMKVKVG